MTYYKIMRYLKHQGLRHSKADYVRQMIRALVNEKKGAPKRNNCGMCSNPGCAGGCYDY